MSWPVPAPELVVVTDRHQTSHAGRAGGPGRAGRGVVEVVAAAVEGGARCVLLRDKDLARPERRRLAQALAAVLAPARGRLIVASDAGLAAEVGAWAVHLAATDPWPPSAEWAGAIGRSCHTVDELRAARQEGATYATLSPVFASPSKPGYGPPLGPGGLAAARGAVGHLPMLALGGVGPGRVAACVAAGADGIAVMGEIMRAADPAAAVRRLAGELAAAAADRSPGQAARARAESGEGTGWPVEDVGADRASGAVPGRGAPAGATGIQGGGAGDP